MQIVLGILDRFKKDDDPSEIYEKGSALNRDGRYEEAIVYLDKALRLRPEYSIAWIVKSSALTQLGRYEEALKCWDEALKLCPNEPYLLDAKAGTLESLGRYDEAKKLREQANKLFGWK